VKSLLRKRVYRSKIIFLVKEEWVIVVYRELKSSLMCTIKKELENYIHISELVHESNESNYI
jgi:hypothetical protein